MEATRQLKPVEKLEAIATDLPKMIEDSSSNLGELKEEGEDTCQKLTSQTSSRTFYILPWFNLILILHQ